MKYDTKLSLIRAGWLLTLPLRATVLLTATALAALAASAYVAKQPQVPVSIGRGYYAILPQKLLLASHLQPEWKDAKLEWTKLNGPGEVIA